MEDQIQNSFGAESLDQDRDSESYEDAVPQESIEDQVEDQISEDIERDVEQVSESGMFSRAEESVALNSHKF